MKKFIKYNNSDFLESNDRHKDLIKISDSLLFDTRTDISKINKICIPISQLSLLGASISSLIPSFHNITQTTNFNTSGLYRLVNSKAGDVLKQAKDGSKWGALKTADKKSKMAKFMDAGTISSTSTTILPFDPTTIMMAVALASIEKQLSNIEKVQKQILSFLEIEKESDIEADVETLTKTISNYKYNWDNKNYIASNHKLVIDIQRNSKKHIISYQKKVSEILKSKQPIFLQSTVNTELKKLIESFKYYRLSLYTYSLSSLLEIMLSGNYNEEYITNIKEDIKVNTTKYHEFYSQCLEFLEKSSKSTVEKNVLKGIGTAGKAVGNFIGNIPLIKEGPVDEFLQEKGAKIEEVANEIGENPAKSFKEMENTNTDIFIDKMEELIQIYNHTTEVCFDKNNIYLIAE